MSNLTPAEYFDLGALESWNFMDWSIGEINVTALNTYLDGFCSQLKEQGLDRVILSFAQVCDISLIVKSEFANLSTSDALYMLYKNVDGAMINDKTTFEYIIDRFDLNGVITGLAFGGVSAQASDWKFDFSSQSPKEQAKALVDWAFSMKIGQLDFDIELNSVCEQSEPSQMAEFFTTLKIAMGENPLTLTVMGDTNYWGPFGSVLKPLFEAGKLSDMFNGINLMLYNGQYYLNAGQTPIEGWDLELWINQVAQAGAMSEEEAASYLNIGFNAKLDYTSASTSGGPLPYSDMPLGISNGGAARFILEALITSLKAYTKDQSMQLGKSFFWDSNAVYTVSANNNYECTFFSKTEDFEKDFFAYSYSCL
ncbi:MAG: hypothetical protein S4CHLAM20_15440 [Chlamydiia bacterium]|nr:hypothetical protein [Chlamydiia bacterium]